MAASGRVDAYAAAILSIAQSEDRVSQVEDDLFRFARTFEASDELLRSLTDPQLPPARRVAVIEELMGGKALPVSVALVGMVVAAGRASDLPSIVDRFVELAVAERRRDVAEIRSAVPLDDATVARLTDALGRALDKDLEVKVIVDPTILGGIVARVGDTVIDGSVRRRLDQLKESL